MGLLMWSTGFDDMFLKEHPTDLEIENTSECSWISGSRAQAEAGGCSMWSILLGQDLCCLVQMCGAEGKALVWRKSKVSHSLEPLQLPILPPPSFTPPKLTPLPILPPCTQSASAASHCYRQSRTRAFSALLNEMSSFKSTGSIWNKWKVNDSPNHYWCY